MKDVRNVRAYDRKQNGFAPIALIIVAVGVIGAGLLGLQLFKNKSAPVPPAITPTTSDVGGGLPEPNEEKNRPTLHVDEVVQGEDSSVTLPVATSSTSTTALHFSKIDLPSPVRSTTSSTGTTSLPATPKSTTTPSKEKVDTTGWGKITSTLGFSIMYPHPKMGAFWGDDEYFQVIFGVPLTRVTEDENIMDHIGDNLGRVCPLAESITVIKPSSEGVGDVKTWALNYLHKEERDENDRTVAKETVTLGKYFGVDGVLIAREMDGKGSYVKESCAIKDIFLVHDMYVYRFSGPAASPRTNVSRVGDLKKQYLDMVDEEWGKILQTFAFGPQLINSLTVPHRAAPSLSGPQLVERNTLLTSLRAEPYYEDNTTYSSKDWDEPCVSGPDSKLPSQSGKMTAGPGIYFSSRSVVGESRAEVHGYNAKGEHTGPMPSVATSFGDASFPEDIAREFHTTDDYHGGYFIVLEDNIDGKIVIKGKTYGVVILRISGEGNSCTIAEVPIPLTPFSIATLPVKKAGDLGPISYDIDGDGVEDFVLSLLHPLTQKKIEELNRVLKDIADSDNVSKNKDNPFYFLLPD